MLDRVGTIFAGSIQSCNTVLGGKRVHGRIHLVTQTLRPYFELAVDAVHNYVMEESYHDVVSVERTVPSLVVDWHGRRSFEWGKHAMQCPDSEAHLKRASSLN